MKVCLEDLSRIVGELWDEPAARGQSPPRENQMKKCNSKAVAVEWQVFVV